MHRGLKHFVASGSLVLSAVLGTAAPAEAAEAPAAPPNLRSIPDAAGDVVDAEGAKLNDARGDILEAAAVYKADKVQFEVRVARFTDPVRDPNWNSDSTYMSWLLDTTGDSKGDFSIEYGLQNDRLYAAVFRVGAPDDAPAVCKVDEVLVGNVGYGLRVDPACLGWPEAIAWSVEASYDTNPKDDEAPATEDRAPDTGLTAPMRAPAGAKRPPGGAASLNDAATQSGSSAAAGQGDQEATAAAAATAAVAAKLPTQDGSSASPPGQEASTRAHASAAASSMTASGKASGGSAGQSDDLDQTDSPAAAPTASAERAAASSDDAPGIPSAVIAVAASLPLVLVGILWIVLRSRRAASFD